MTNDELATFTIAAPNSKDAIPAGCDNLAECTCGNCFAIPAPPADLWD